MTEITPVLGVSPVEFRKSVSVIAKVIGDEEFANKAEWASTEELVGIIKNRFNSNTSGKKHKHCGNDHKHHCKCHREAAKLDDVSSRLEGIEDALVLKALLDLRADPDKRLSLWKGNQTASDIIRNKTNVLLAAGAADVKEQTKLAGTEGTFTKDDLDDLPGAFVAANHKHLPSKDLMLWYLGDLNGIGLRVASDLEDIQNGKLLPSNLEQMNDLIVAAKRISSLACTAAVLMEKMEKTHDN